MRMRSTVMALSLLLTLSVFAAPVGWRMDGTGLFPTAAPQTQWSTTDRVVWATPLPQWGNANPVLVGDRIFVTAEPSTLICLNRDGKILWQQSVEYKDLPFTGGSAETQQKIEALNAQVAAIQTELNPKREQLKLLEDEAKAAAAVNPDDKTAREKVDAARKEIRQLEGKIGAIQLQIEPLTPPSGWKMPPTNADNGYASDTPVSDGKYVYAAFGTGIVACFNMDGERQWIRFCDKPTHGWGHNCSPMLIGDILVVHFIDMFGLDAKTGKEIWRVRRSKAWGTPALTKLGTLDVLVTDCGEIVNVADGKMLAETKMRLDYGSAFVKDHIAYMASAKQVKAFQLGMDTDGKVTVQLLWETLVSDTPRNVDERNYAAPLLVDGLLYIMNHRSLLTVLDARTGAIAYQQKLNLGGTAYPTPILVGNVIIISSDNGKSIVIAPGPTYQEISRCTFDGFRTTPVCDGKRMYIRTTTKRDSKLYCIGE